MTELRRQPRFDSPSSPARYSRHGPQEATKVPLETPPVQQAQATPPRLRPAQLAPRLQRDVEVQARQASLLQDQAMKRTELDRAEVERALQSESSITNAAKALGVARRTLQDRMRALGMERGKAGHPTRAIKYRKRRRRYGIPAVAVGVAALVGGVLVGSRLAGKKGGGA